MKHEPRPAVHMEKQLEWAGKLSGTEFLWVSRVGQTVLARLMESQIWYQLAGSMALWLCGSGEEGFRKGTMASACLSIWEKAVPQLSP